MQNVENRPLPQALSPANEKNPKEHKNRHPTAPLQPSLPNSEKRSFKRLGPYEFSIDQKIGSGMSGDAYVGVNTDSYELVCVKVVDREVFKTAEQKLLLDN